jgi:hypothetical protein
MSATFRDPGRGFMAYPRVLEFDSYPAAAPDGRVAVLRRESAGSHAEVALRIRHRVDPARALVGRPVAAAPRLLRRFLSDGSWAQRLSCQCALEAAAGQEADPALMRARALLVQAEIAVGLVAQACLDWPRLLGEAPQLRHLRYARTAMDTLVVRLWQRGDPLDADASIASPVEAELPVSALIEAIETAVLPRAPADPARLADWAARSSAPLARLVRAAARVRLNAAIPVAAAVPGLLAQEAALARDPGFCDAPHLGGGAADPTPFARMPPVPGSARFGPLGARLLARAARAQATVEALARLDPPPIRVHAPGPGTGAALVEALRGPITHRLRCDRGGHVAELAGVAPADWMRHPSGPLAATLRALPRDRFPADAPLVLAAHDPCGAFELRQEQADI